MTNPGPEESRNARAAEPDTPVAPDSPDSHDSQDSEVPPRPVTPHDEPDVATTALADLARTAELTWKRARRWLIFVVGVSIVLFGLIVGILPGVPGIPIMFLGFALLATEFIWARKVLKRLKEQALALKARAERAIGLTPSTPPTDPTSQASSPRAVATGESQDASPPSTDLNKQGNASGSHDQRGAA
ncbi:MAG: PGPGW domain-containing protein [Phycisphaerales bacterium]